MALSHHSFISIPPTSHFSLQNLPYGVFSTEENSQKRIGTRVGDTVVDLSVLEQHNLFNEYCETKQGFFNQPTLNYFAAQDRGIQKKIRYRLQDLLSADNRTLRDNKALCQQAFHPHDKVTMHLPGQIPNYTDFYSSIDHAKNTGRLFRDKDNPLLPNYVHLPVAYHGRASSIIPSGYPIIRPQGQILPPGADLPILASTKALDFELEMAFFIGKENKLGEPISASQASDHIFGLVILNDWSARDIQKWEYVPLGPFLSKSFATTISPWVVTLDALMPFKVTPRQQYPKPLDYLCYAEDFSLNIQLEVALKTTKMTHPEIICQSHFSYLYWTMAQQLAHHTVAGCNMQVMDLLASGTISGPEPTQAGCLLERTLGGAQPLVLSNGETRTYLQEGDEVIMTAFCEGDGYRVGFGEARGLIL